MTEKVSDVELFCQVLEKYPSARTIDWDEAAGVAESWMLQTLSSWAAMSVAHPSIKDLEQTSLTTCVSDLREAANTMSLIYLSALQSKKLMGWVHALLNQSEGSNDRSSSYASMENISTLSTHARTATGVVGATYSNTATGILSLKDRMRLAASVPPKDVRIGKMCW